MTLTMEAGPAAASAGFGESGFSGFGGDIPRLGIGPAIQGGVFSEGNYTTVVPIFQPTLIFVNGELLVPR